MEKLNDLTILLQLVLFTKLIIGIIILYAGSGGS
jgi:hypothetical protein